MANQNPYNKVFALPYHAPIVDAQTGKLTPAWQAAFAQGIVPALQGLGATGSSGGATGAPGAPGTPGPAGESANTYIPVNQASHGFTSGQPVYFDGISWNLAKADHIDTLATGIIDVVDASNFKVYQSGTLSVFTSLVPGNYYFVSDATAGLLTLTEPTDILSYSNPILLSITDVLGMVLPYRPSQTVSYIEPTNTTTPLWILRRGL